MIADAETARAMASAANYERPAQVCPECGATFRPRSGHALRCSSACQKRGARARAKARRETAWLATDVSPYLEPQP